MAFPDVIYGPESEPYNTYDPVTPVPGDNGSGGQVAQRGRHPLGQQLVLQDGRKFRFALNNSSNASISGDVQQSAIILTTDQSMACAAGAVGDRIVTFTHGATTVVLNYFAEGYAIISLDPGQGHSYKVASHAALRNATAGDVVNLSPGNAVRAVLTTTSDLSLLANPYAGVLIMAATITGMPVGVAVSVIPTSDWGWLQTRGIAGVRSSASVTIGSPAVMLLSGGTAGSVAPAGAATQPQVGFIQMVEGTAEASGVFLTLDG